MKMYQRHKKLFFNILIQISFIIVSFITVSSYLTHNYINGVSNADLIDIKYHIQQCVEILSDFHYGIMPAFNHFNAVLGNAESTFYPWSSFMPIMLGLTFHFPLNITMKFTIFLAPYLLLNTIFYASHKYFANYATQWLVAVLYLGTLEIIIHMVTNMDIGMSFGLSAMTLAIFGYFYYIENNKWKMLTSGMILACYTSVVIGVLTLITLIILALMNVKNFTKNQIIIGIKATMVTLLSTIMIWLPMCILMLSNNIYTPNTNFILDNKIPLNNIFSSFLGIVSIISIILLIISLFIWNVMTRQEHTLIITSSIYILISISIIPVYILQYTPFEAIQYMQRLSMIINFFIIVAVLPHVINYFQQDRQNIKTKILILFFIICSINSMFMPILFTYIPQKPTMGLVNKSIVKDLKQHNTNDRQFQQFSRAIMHRKINQQAYISDYSPQNVLNKYNIHSYKFLKSQSSIKSYTPNIPIQKYYQEHHIKVINNGIKFYQKRTEHDRTIPIIIYHAQKYNFYDNSHSLKYKFSQYEPKVSTITKGQHTITFKTPYMWYRILANVISLSSIIIFAGISLRIRKKHEK